MSLFDAFGEGGHAYYDSAFEIDAMKIQPGEFCVTSRNIAIVTVLGSCVAACVRDPQSGVGGMNHFLLPDDPNAEEGSILSHGGRYGIWAMERLINDLLKSIRTRRDRLEAKVFGGAAVIDSVVGASVGARNASFVTEYLQREGIRMVARDLGGDAPRKVYFFPATGTVRVKYLRRLKNNTVQRRDADYASLLARAKPDAPVELF